MLALVIYLLRSPLLYRQTTVKLQAIATATLARQDEFLDKPEQQIERILARADANLDLRLLFLAADGSLLYDTRPDEGRLSLPRENVLRQNALLRDEKGRAWLYSSADLADGRRLLVTTPRPRVKILSVLQDELFPPFWTAGAIALIFSLILAFVMARWVADPLQKMLTATRSVPMERADISARGPQEVRELTEAFNEMVTRVQNTQQSQREFVANVSHELKTPLTSIQGFAQALLDGTAETPELRQQAAQVIYDESGRMHRLALDLLDLARFDAGIAEMEFSPLDLGALLRNSCEKFALRAKEKEVDLQINAKNLPSMLGDGDRLSQVFTNLIDNALKHTDARGQIRVKAEDVGDWIHVNIADSGSGIPAEALPHIFERFYQADPSRKARENHNSGLGLAIAKEIVLAHGGKIAAHSKVGEGTIFSLSLPQVDEATILSKRKT